MLVVMLVPHMVQTLLPLADYQSKRCGPSCAAAGGTAGGTAGGAAHTGAAVGGCKRCL
jgi:hypothetical protein